MNRNYTRLLFISASAVAILPGVFLIITPQTVMGVYGLTLDTAGAFTVRMQGVLLIGFAIVYWFARNAAEQPLQTAVLLAGLITNLITTVIVLLAVVDGTINAAGWPAAALHGALAIGFAYALSRARW